MITGRVSVGTADARKYGWAQGNTISIPNNTWTILPLDLEVADPGGMHDNVVNNHRITFTPGGLYAATMQISWVPNGTGGRGIRFRQPVEGFGDQTVASSFVPGLATTSLPASTDQAQQCTMQPGGATDEYFWIEVWQNSGVALDCTKVGFDTPSMMAGRIGAL